ncbi:DUF4396 domain-containing protein [Clostridium botulinum]|uniref:DUF4396 domain-containing protein n=1 Tax=Clostridium botulinum TaxID=1491 RepID=UPI000D131FDF|nr:DUF4396 domain-containing protein [Clostridium botulinum]AVQ47606.1 hypothetical protein C7M60_18370 [Clostridium botulinum]AVQ51169.1 hypothetical protein C7M58_18395 [Clostridium botulinum]
MKKLFTSIAIFMCVILILGQIRIFKNVVFPSEIKHENNRTHLNTGNTVRISGESSKEIGTKVTDILFPALDYESKPDGLIIYKGDNWKDMLALMPLVKKYNSTIIPFNEKDESSLLSYINKLEPKGISKLNNAQVIICGDNINTLKNNLERRGIRVTNINYKDTNSLLEKVYNSVFSNSDKCYGYIVSDEDPLMTVPTATWMVQNGGVPLYLNNEKKLYSSSKKILPNISKIYVIGRKNNVDEEAIKSLKVPVQKVYGYNPENFAINFSKFYDREEGFGWHSNRSRDDSNHNFIVCSKEEPLMALVGSQLALKGKVGSILWTNKNYLSPLTENYLWRMKPNYWVTPAEGPYNSLWVIGNENILPFSIQSRADYTEEIKPYKTMGDQGVSGLDGISIIFSLISILGTIWVSLHLYFRMKNLSTLTKLMWILTVLLLGPIGIWFYIISYINSPWIKINGKIIYLRSLWKQTSVATLSGLAFGGASLIVVNYILTYIGSPLIPFYARFGFYLLGNPMIIKMLISYLISFLLDLFVFRPTMLIEMKDIKYKDAVKESVLLVFISLTSISIGMRLSIWWFNMSYSPTMLQEDNILWFGFMAISVFIGFLTAYIPNWILVRSGKKMGTL